MADLHTEPRAPLHARRPLKSAADRNVEANARLTGSTAVVLLVLFAIEGLTLFRIVPLLSWHVFIGMMLVPPVTLKVASTGYRFVRYYAGSPAYRRKGPPPPLLRLLGPFVVILTAILLISGIALVFVGPSSRGGWLFIHKASFVLWFGAMAIHVLGHLLETARLAPRDYYWRTRRQIAGAGVRQWGIAASVSIGFLLGALVVGRAGHFFAG